MFKRDWWAGSDPDDSDDLENESLLKMGIGIFVLILALIWIGCYFYFN
jgi:hypothetical protein